MASTVAPATTTAAGTAVPARGRAGHPALVGTLALVGSGAMLVAGLAAAYLSVRNANRADFVPDEMKFNNYGGLVTLATVGIASMGAEWAMTAVRNGQRRYGTMGWGLAAVMGLAGMNGIWFIGRQLALGVADSPYATIVYGLFAVAGLAVALGVGASLLALARTEGGHISAERPYLGRASAWVVHLGTLAWLTAFALVYLYK